MRLPVMIATTAPGGRLPPSPEPPRPDYVPLWDPEPPGAGDPTARTSGSMETLCGDLGLSTWGNDDFAVADSGPQVKLQLAPDAPVVIGRQETGIPPYLDPSYHS